MDFFAGKPGDAKPFWQKAFEHDEPAKQGPRVLDFLREVARVAEVEAPLAELVPEDRAARLRGNVRGIPCRIVVAYSGAVRHLELRYPSQLEPIELEYNPELEQQRPQARQVLAPGVFIADPSAEQQLPLFRALPEELQRRVLTDMRRQRIRFFRSQREAHKNTLWDALGEHPQPVELLSGVLVLSADFASARAVLAPIS